MSKFHYLAATGSALVLATTFAGTALAWHPIGTITKYVQNVTTSSASADANSASSAVSAKPGDELKYTITIKDTAVPAANNYNDLAFIKLTDTLPAGVELVSSPSTRTISEDLGTLTPGKSVTKTYTVKVTASVKDGQVIENKACFEGNSVVKDTPQSGCDVADVKISIPAPKQIQVCELSTKKLITITEDKFDAQKYSKDLTKCETPTTPTTPETPAQPGQVLPAELPSTGIASIITGTTGLGALTYAGASYLQSRRK